MHIYNVTVNVDTTIHEEWLQWMEDIHIPAMLATKKFIKAQLVKVLVDEAMGGITYSIQYYLKDAHMLQQYYQENAVVMQQKTTKKFADKLVVFRTELEVIGVYNV